jgi:hypothetical protein
MKADDLREGSTVRPSAPEATPTMLDLSPYIEALSVNMTALADAGRLTDDAICAYADALAGLKMQSYTLTGRWFPADDHPVSQLAVRMTLDGVVRLPRKSKKALKKAWTGRPLSPREQRRFYRIDVDEAQNGR